jgi:hypothetical protein
VIQEFEMAGDFEWSLRLRSALISHVRQFLIIGAIGLVCLGYLFFEGKLSISTTPVFLVVLSNCWGLFLIIVLLGYGLVEIPRQFWQAGNNTARLSELYMKLSGMGEDMEETKFALNEIVKLLNAASYLLPKNSELTENLNFVLGLCPIEVMEHQRAMQSHLSKDAAKQLGEITLKSLVKLHMELKDTLAEHQRSKYRWENVMEEALALEDIIAAAGSPFRRIAFSFVEPRNGRLAACKDAIEWFWLTKAKPLGFRVLALVFILLSVLIVLGETTLFLQIPIGVLPLLFTSDHGVTLTQLLCAGPLAYILSCTYFGLFNLKLSGWYGLYPNNHTDPSNLVWSAFYMCRLTAPLCYNVLLLLKVQRTVYSQVYDLIDLVPIVGTQFATFFPLLVIVFCALNLFNVYGRVMSTLGMGSLSFSHKHKADKVSSGKQIVMKHRVEREKMYKNHARGNVIEMANKNNAEEPRRGFQFRGGV